MFLWCSSENYSFQWYTAKDFYKQPPDWVRLIQGSEFSGIMVDDDKNWYMLNMPLYKF